MEEEKKVLVLPFGKQIQVGNYTVLKRTRVLTKAQLKQLRDDSDIPAELRSKLTRSGLPYIRVEDISRMWAVEFCCNTGVYVYVDRMLPLALQAEKEGREIKTDGVTDFAHLFGMWMTDTCVQGDAAYYADKANALAALVARNTSHREETAEEKAADDKVLEEVKASEEAKAAIIDMAGQVLQEEGGEHEGQ